VRFDWDLTKAASNLTIHGIPFQEAETVFGDIFADTIVDEAHSADEVRWLTMGMSDQGRLLVVWHTDRGDVIRIFGARLATPTERRMYESG